MLAHRLRHRVQIHSLTVSIDSDTGAQTETWGVVDGSVPAEILPLNGRELIAAQAIQSAINSKIIIRHRSDLTESMRLVNDSIIYDIKAILPDPTLRRYLVLMCEGRNG